MHQFLAWLCYWRLRSGVLRTQPLASFLCQVFSQVCACRYRSDEDDPASRISAVPGTVSGGWLRKLFQIAPGLAPGTTTLRAHVPSVARLTGCAGMAAGACLLSPGEVVCRSRCCRIKAATVPRQGPRVASLPAPRALTSHLLAGSF